MNRSTRSYEEKENLIPRYARIAVRKAYRDTMGIAGFVIQVHDGFLVKAYPDGTYEQLKKLKEPTTVKPGERIRIR